MFRRPPLNRIGPVFKTSEDKIRNLETRQAQPHPLSLSGSEGLKIFPLPNIERITSKCSLKKTRRRLFDFRIKRILRIGWQ
jgi:hypothetical protein